MVLIVMQNKVKYKLIFQKITKRRNFKLPLNPSCFAGEERRRHFLVFLTLTLISFTEHKGLEGGLAEDTLNRAKYYHMCMYTILMTRLPYVHIFSSAYLNTILI